MPEFETPEPISVTITLGVGDVRIVATDRTDTVVTVRPSDPADESDVQAAQQVRVEYSNGTLEIAGQRIRAFDFSRKTRSVGVVVELPIGSSVAGDLQMGDYTGVGELGECRCKTSMGNVRLQRTGQLRVDTSHGQVSVEHVAGDADIRTGSGHVRVGEIAGTAGIRNSNGATEIDSVGSDVRVRASNGAITIERAGANVDAKTANGNVRLGEVIRGSVQLGTPAGHVDVGIAEGTAAWLDVNTAFGHVTNELTTASQPGESDETVEVRARTSYGDITIHRS